MILLSDPWLSDALLNKAPATMVVDWLQDHDATVADIAQLYAGTQPTHVDGLPRDLLLYWIEVVLGRGLAEEVGFTSAFLSYPGGHAAIMAEGGVVPTFASQRTPGSPWSPPSPEDGVPRMGMTELLNGRPFEMEGGENWEWYRRMHAGFAVALRWQKRTALGCKWAKDVRMERFAQMLKKNPSLIESRKVCIDAGFLWPIQDGANGDFVDAMAGIGVPAVATELVKFGRRWVRNFRQTLTAPDLIAREPRRTTP